MRLKLFALSGAALLAWIVPLTALDKKIGWHKGLQGIALLSALACAIEAARTASNLAEDTSYQEAKKMVVVADLQHELATEGFLSESERTLKAQQYLDSLASATATDRNDTAPSPAPLQGEDLEEPHQSHPIPENWQFPNPKIEPTSVVRGAVVACIRAGFNQSKTIEAIWGVKRSGANPNYDAAKFWYQSILKELMGE